jgi:hypothetical protein
MRFLGVPVSSAFSLALAAEEASPSPSGFDREIETPASVRSPAGISLFTYFITAVLLASRPTVDILLRLKTEESQALGY